MNAEDVLAVDYFRSKSRSESLSFNVKVEDRCGHQRVIVYLLFINEKLTQCRTLLHKLASNVQKTSKAAS